MYMKHPTLFSLHFPSFIDKLYWGIYSASRSTHHFFTCIHKSTLIISIPLLYHPSPSKSENLVTKSPPKRLDESS